MKADQNHKPLILRLSSKIVLALLSSVLLILSFPNFDQGWLAWVALVPLILAGYSQRPLIAFALGLLCGLGAIFSICFWMFAIPGFRLFLAVFLASYLAMYPALWCLALTWLKRGSKSSIILGSALWVALDYLRAHAGFLAVSWTTLAQSQHDNIAGLQLAAFTGEYGVTFIIVMANIAIAEAFLEKRWKHLKVVAFFIALTHILGFIIIQQNNKGEKLRVAVVQPSILHEEIKTPQGRLNALDRLERLTISSTSFKPEIVVWPETAVRDPKRDVKLYARLKTLARTINTPILTGASEHMKFTNSGENRDATVKLNQFQYNSAYFISPKGSDMAAPYRKQILVPFGEYSPMASFLNWPSWLAPQVFNVLPGEGYKYFVLDQGRRVSPVICWESLFSDYVRLMVKEDTDLLVQLTNDNWFGRTAAPRQHNAASVLRAVENQTPIVIASNTGPSQIIDVFGRVVAELPNLFTNGVVSAEVNLRYKETFYTRYGDVFAFICLAILSIFALTKILFRKNIAELFVNPFRIANIPK